MSTSHVVSVSEDGWLAELQVQFTRSLHTLFVWLQQSWWTEFAFRVQSLTLILDTCIHVRAINQTTCQRQICTHRFLSFLFCGKLSKPLWQLYRKLELTLLTLPPVTCEQPVQQKKSLSVLLSYVAYASHPSTSLAKCRQSILQLCCPTGILPCEIRLAFYGESQLR